VPFSPDGNVATVIYSHIADVQTRGALAMASRSWRDVSMLPASLPRRLDLDGLSKSQIDRLLDVDELTSLDEERMLELAGVDKEDFCEWAAARAGCLKLIVWALERGFPWGGYPPGLVSDDVLALRMWRANDVFVLRTWRAMCPALQEWWPEAAQPEDWEGVTMDNGRVARLLLEDFGLTGAVPAEIGRLSALRDLDLGGNQLTSLPAEIGRLTSLEGLSLIGNRLTSVPAEIGQLTALERLYFCDNQLTNAPAEIGQLTSLVELNLKLVGGDRAAHVADGVVAREQSADESASGDRAAHGAVDFGTPRQSADDRAGGVRAAYVAGTVGPRRQSVSGGL